MRCSVSASLIIGTVVAISSLAVYQTWFDTCRAGPNQTQPTDEQIVASFKTLSRKDQIDILKRTTALNKRLQEYVDEQD